MKILASRPTALSGVLVALLAASGAVAQEAPAGSASAQATNTNTSVGEVVVTAQKREQRLQDVPLAIQAFGGESLENSGIKSATDVLGQVPSASFQSSTPTQTVLQMRGIQQNPSADPSVAMYVDEIPLGFPGYPFLPNIGALDLQRIEVVRGPQGTLYGLGAMGGTVRVITADPSTTEGLTAR
jgi:iron complex outermembrane receptor protein